MRDRSEWSLFIRVELMTEGALIALCFSEGVLYGSVHSS